MDAQQTLADLTEISSQIQAAVVFDDTGEIAGATIADDGRAASLAAGAARLLAEAQALTPTAPPLTQLEAATGDGSVFVVADGPTRIAATTGPEPTGGLVFYDLKSALRSLVEKPAPEKGAPAAKKPAAKKPAPKKKPAAKKPAATKSPAKKPAPKKKPDAS